MAQQNPPPRSDHEHDPNAVVEGDVHTVNNMGIESKLDSAFEDENERDEKRQRIEPSPIGPDTVEPKSISPNEIEEPIQSPTKIEDPIKILNADQN